jgi:hypothetical protein
MPVNAASACPRARRRTLARAPCAGGAGSLRQGVHARGERGEAAMLLAGGGVGCEGLSRRGLGRARAFCGIAGRPTPVLLPIRECRAPGADAPREAVLRRPCAPRDGQWASGRGRSGGRGGRRARRGGRAGRAWARAAPRAPRPATSRRGSGLGGPRGRHAHFVRWGRQRPGCFAPPGGSRARGGAGDGGGSARRQVRRARASHRERRWARPAPGGRPSPPRRRHPLPPHYVLVVGPIKV